MPRKLKSPSDPSLRNPHVQGHGFLPRAISIENVQGHGFQPCHYHPKIRVGFSPRSAFPNRPPALPFVAHTCRGTPSAVPLPPQNKDGLQPLSNLYVHPCPQCQSLQHSSAPTAPFLSPPKPTGKNVSSNRTAMPLCSSMSFAPAFEPNDSNSTTSSSCPTTSTYSSPLPAAGPSKKPCSSSKAAFPSASNARPATPARSGSAGSPTV